MDAIDRLKAQAAARRDAAIRAAQLDYAHACKEIRAIERRLARDSPRPRGIRALRPGTAVWHADRILSEHGPMTLNELAFEVTQAGFKPKSPRALLSNLGAGLRFHERRFQRVGECWVVVGWRQTPHLVPPEARQHNK